VLLALALVDRPTLGRNVQRALNAGGLAALVAIMAAFAFAHADSATLYHGGSLAFAIAVAILIASIMRAPAGVVARVLRFRPFVMLGLISYGVYLWHWPIIVYATEARVGLAGAALDAFRLGLSLAFALASYFLLERPIRVRWRQRLRWPLAPAAIGLGLAAIVIGTTGATAAPGFFGTRPPTVTSSTTLAPQQAGNPTHVVLVGDSLAASLGPGLDDAMAARGVRFETAATPGCSMLRGVTVAANGRPYPWSRPCAKAIPPALRTVVDTAPRPDLVLWLSTWDAVDRELGGRRVELGSTAGRLVLSSEVKRTAALLTARGARLVILTIPRPVAGSLAVLPGLDEAARVRELNRLYQRSGPTADGRVSIFDLGSIVCPDGRCPRRVQGIELRPDGAHFGTKGSAYVGRQLAAAVLTCWKTPAKCSAPDPNSVTPSQSQP
ncbi:MAG: acyltransferase family protein, partial [Acidimicrobiia bacterium]